MERLSPQAHLGILVCALATTLPILLSRCFRTKSFCDLIRQPQLGVMMMKLMCDSTSIGITSIILQETGRGKTVQSSLDTCLRRND